MASNSDNDGVLIYTGDGVSTGYIQERATQVNEMVANMEGLPCSPLGRCGIRVIFYPQASGGIYIKPVCMEGRPDCAETCGAYASFLVSGYPGSLGGDLPPDLLRESI